MAAAYPHMDRVRLFVEKERVLLGRRLELVQQVVYELERPDLRRTRSPENPQPGLRAL